MNNIINKTMKYKIIKEGYMWKLEDRVMSHMKEGYECVGGLQVYTEGDGAYKQTFYFQAIIKK